MRSISLMNIQLKRRCRETNGYATSCQSHEAVTCNVLTHPSEVLRLKAVPSSSIQETSLVWMCHCGIKQIKYEQTQVNIIYELKMRMWDSRRLAAILLQKKLGQLVQNGFTVKSHKLLTTHLRMTKSSQSIITHTYMPT